MTSPERDAEVRAACLANWPDADSMAYNPLCCRWPKSCSVPGAPEVVTSPSEPVPDPDVRERIEDALMYAIGEEMPMGVVWNLGRVVDRLIVKLPELAHPPQPVGGTTMPEAWSDLIAALTLMAKHQTNAISPTHCEHDTLTVLSDSTKFTEEELDQLDTWGFFPADGAFKSYYYGSA